MTAVLSACALVLLATAAHASEEGGMVSISPRLVILQIVNFGILVAVVFYIFRKFLLPGLQKRAEQVKRAIDDAEKAKVEMQRLVAEHAKQVEDVRKRAKEILDNSAAQATRDRDEVMHKAKIEATAALERATAEIEREKVRVLTEIRSEVADLTIEATRRLLEKEVDGETNRRLVDQFVAQLEPHTLGK